MSERCSTDDRFIIAEHPIRTTDNVQYLTDEEIDKFLDELDHNGDGRIDYDEVELNLDKVHRELEMKHGAHHVTNPENEHHDEQVRHAFLRSLMGSDARRIPRSEFAQIVRSWKVPSLQQSKREEDNEKDYVQKLPEWRRIRAYWAVYGPEAVFTCFVIATQLAFGIWQLVKYETTPQYRAGFGWGVVMAKTCAGALYPTFFFLILSMSRYFSTWMRRSYLISRFLNWDLSQKFHVRISCVAVLLATLHAIGHLTGSFLHGSRPENQQEVATVLGPDAVPRPYIDYVRSLPGFTGITALGLFYILCLLSIPQVRRWNYEVFQLGHLLMFPIIGLMMAHGTAALFQWPMFGYFLAVPTLLVLVERSIRVLLGFHRIKAKLKVLDRETVEIAAKIPSERLWKYKAGQYIFLQVPEISFFQWHPFTVSFCRGTDVMVHIKTDGNWTEKLRDLGGPTGTAEVDIGINGPFGAPAQRFYDFSHSIIIGSGIGVTPFSGILADLQYKDDIDHSTSNASQPSLNAESHTLSTAEHRRSNEVSAEIASVSPCNAQNEKIITSAGQSLPEDYRRVDLHWIVRDRNYLLWFSDLLNEVYISQHRHHQAPDPTHLDIRMNTHVTAKRKAISTHVYRWMLELHRTKEHPASPLTGLLNPTHFGRPDFDVILDEHYDDMLDFRASRRMQVESTSDSAEKKSASSEIKVGVFFCGAPVVGEILADKCGELSIRGRRDGSKIEYHFMMEVFD
jgi:predicted ferric reductase